MLIDIHTHNMLSSNDLAVHNITVLEVKSFLAKKENRLFSIGFHPWIADSYTDELFEKIEFYATNKNCVLVGECGLDKYSKVPFNTQKVVFEKQITLSERLKKPLLIHCVGYYNELFALKKKLQPSQPWIIHGFRGKPQLAKQALKLDIFLSYGVHFNDESVLVTPLDKLCIETEESKQNIELIYQKVTAIKSCKTEALVASTTILNNLKLV